MSIFAQITPSAPVAPEKPHRMEIHGIARHDPYFWLKERENPEVRNYLEAENQYLENILKPNKLLREKIFSEMKARIKQDDSSYPFVHRGYRYYRRYEAGKEYPIFARSPDSLAADEEVLLDVNDLAVGHEYVSVHFPEVSPDSKKIIYAADFSGRRFYDLYVRDLTTGKLIGEPIRNTTGNAEWANDNKTFFYAKQDPETLRARWIFRHELGNSKDVLVFEENDDTFDVGVSRSRTDSFIFIQSSSTLSSEWRVLDANNSKSKPYVFLPRENNHEYSIEDGGDAFYVTTNWQAKNFRLMRAPHSAAPKETWQEVVAHRENVLLEGSTFFRSHYVLSEREGGQTILSVVNRATGQKDLVQFLDPVYVVGVETNLNFETDFLRYGYESLNRPTSVFEYSFESKISALRKTQEVPTFDPALFATERVWAKARDGTIVPISVVYRKGFRNEKAPLLVYGYGSYGISSDPSFNSEVISLLDRGFIYAIAHVRGGSEMGRSWYEDGRLLKKMNTFTDFIDVTEHLLRIGYGDPQRVYAQGGSAGGLLMGAVANLRPDLFRGIHAAVPFVDVLTTMLDESIPLTTSEYDEWGDPRELEYYRAMAEYSPYDQVKNHAYPHILITAGFHDSQVQYWEPAKWAAKLRNRKANNNLVLLFTEMEAGHGGASGRFHALEQTALEFAYFLMIDGKEHGI